MKISYFFLSATEPHRKLRAVSCSTRYTRSSKQMNKQHRKMATHSRHQLCKVDHNQQCKMDASAEHLSSRRYRQISLHNISQT